MPQHLSGLTTDWRGRVTRNKKVSNRLITVLVWGVLLTFYEVGLSHVMSDTDRQLYCPKLGDLSARLYLEFSQFVWAAFYTGFRATFSFVCGSIAGILVAFVMFVSKEFRAVAQALIEPIRPLPPVALNVFYVLWFKLTWIGWFVAIGIGCFMVLVVSTLDSLSMLDINLIRSARSLGARGLNYYWRILLPAIVPSLVAPLRVSLALAFAVSFSSEFMGVDTGLGARILVAKSSMATNEILISLFFLATEAFLLDWLLRCTMLYFDVNSRIALRR